MYNEIFMILFTLMKNETKLLEAKPRFEILDGLRGVAAFLVLAYHHFELTCGGGPAGALINHGYLAVDFFFILSGYVIGYAYDDRWDRMSTLAFFKRRLIRLHPMILFATLFCAGLFYFGTCDVFGKIGTCTAQQLGLAVLLSILMIPMPVAWDIRGWSELNPVNGNAWTLYYEYFANILYALIIRRFSKLMLALFVLASSFLTLNLALNWDVFGTLAERSAEQFTMIGGWSLNAREITIGFSRLLFPFFAGLLLSRCKKAIKIRCGFWWCATALVVLLALPRVGGVNHGLFNGIYEAVTVLILFPILVTIGAGSTVSGRTAQFCKWLGEISYPLYVIHYGIVFTLFGGWLFAHPKAPTEQVVVLGCFSFLFSIFTAWAALKLIDQPIRKWLTQRSANHQDKQ